MTTPPPETGPRSDWRLLPGSQLPEQLDRVFSQAYRFWHAQMPMQGFDWTPVELTEDPGKHESGWIGAPHWNGRLPFNLWYAWEHGRKVPAACGKLMASLLEMPRVSPEAAAEAVSGDLYSLHVLLLQVRVDWYECAPYVAATQQMVAEVLGEWRGGAATRAALQTLGVPAAEARPLAARVVEWNGALGGSCLPKGAAEALAEQLAGVEAATALGAELIGRLAVLKMPRGSRAALRRLGGVLRHLESAMATATAAACAAETGLLLCLDRISAQPEGRG